MAKIFYHADTDGRCAGYIVAKKIKVDNPEDLIEMEYGKKFPFNKINKDENVYIVDYSIEPDEMLKLLKLTENVVWIDHHISTISKYKDFPKTIKGVREDGRAGCVLTWDYFMEEEPAPLAVVYIGDRDVWTWLFKEKTKNFCSGAELYDLHPLSKSWNKLIKEPSKIIEEGKIINKYKAQKDAEYIKKYGYITQFEGYQANCVNAGLVGLEVFDSLNNLEPLQIIYTYDGELYHVSLRSTEIDVSQIALKYGGGGHKGAAGFECKELPWGD